MNKQLDLMNKLLEAAGRPQYSNRYDIPKGYSYNEDGYVVTKEPYPQVEIVTGYLAKSYARAIGHDHFVLSNLCAYRYLNPTKLVSQAKAFAKWVMVSTGLTNMKDISRFDEELDGLVTVAYAIPTQSLLSTMKGRFIQYYNVWMSPNCSMKGRKEINKYLKDEYVDKVRYTTMVNSTRWKPKEVASATTLSESRIKNYFADRGFPKQADRSKACIYEAIAEASREGKNITTILISEISGVARKKVGLVLKELEGELVELYGSY